MRTEPTAWRALLVAALSIGIPPAAFWRLSLREWRTLAPPREEAQLSRAGFDDLAAMFPDDVQ